MPTAYDPEKGWEIIRTLVNKALTEEAPAYIAAGPWENLLNHHGAAVMVQIEQECLTNDHLRLALSGVWIENETRLATLVCAHVEVWVCRR
jgi:Family of unknown function (DUF6869)